MRGEERSHGIELHLLYHVGALAAARAISDGCTTPHTATHNMSSLIFSHIDATCYARISHANNF